MKTYYFDYNATTPVAPEAFRAMESFLKEDFGNPASAHQLSRNPAKMMRTARHSISVLLSAKDDSEIVFTSGGTESNNAAIRSALADNPRKRILTSAVEHSSVLRLCRQLAKEGYEVIEVGVDSQGQLRMDDYKAALNDQTALVSLMWANNETGVIFPIEEIARLARAKGALVHADAVQAAGKISVNLSAGMIDFVSLSAHKLYGPKGIGVLYVRKGVSLHPLIWGGSQERGRRAGTENVPGIAGFGAAAEVVLRDFQQEAKRISDLRDEFEEKLSARVPQIKINGRGCPRIPNTSNICFQGVDAETMLIALDQKGICVSMGSACMSGANEPSHVLKAMGLSDEEARASLRFSFGRGTTREMINVLMDELENLSGRLRNAKHAAAPAGKN